MAEKSAKLIKGIMKYDRRCYGNLLKGEVNSKAGSREGSEKDSGGRELGEKGEEGAPRKYL